MNPHYFLEPPYVAIWGGVIILVGCRALYHFKIIDDNRPDVAFIVMLIWACSVLAGIAVLFDLRPPTR